MKSREITFGIIADAQYSDQDDAGELYYRLSPSKLTDAVNFFESKGVDGLVQLGDLIDRDFVSFSEMLPRLKDRSFPVYNVLGNHEYIIAQEKKADLVNLLNMPNDYYGKTIGSCRFLFLNGNDISFNRWEKGLVEYDEVQAYYDGFDKVSDWWNGAIGSAQLNWLIRELDIAKESGLAVYIFCHFPILPEDKYCLWNREDIFDIIDSYDCVRAWISGHRHRGSREIRKGVLHWCARAMLLGVENNYSLLRIFEDGLEVEGLGAEESFSVNFV